MILQLSPTIPLDTPKGPADAHFLIDYGQEHHLLWVCFVRSTGACWTFPNPEVRLEKNITGGVRTGEDGASDGPNETADRRSETAAELPKKSGSSL